MAGTGAASPPGIPCGSLPRNHPPRGAGLKLADLADYRENPHYPPLEILRNTPSFPNRYLDYYTEDDIENQVHGIPQRLAEEAATAEESLWLSPEERDEFIMFATAKCMQMVRAHLA